MNDLTTLVRRSLDERSGDLPATPPSWDRISAGLRAVRSRRRRRAAGVVGTVAAVAVLGAVLGGVTPASLRRADPATPDGRTQSVFGGRTVGSLAKDTAFLAELRRGVATADVALGDARTLTTGARDVLVAFAGDVGDLRVAMVEVPVGGEDGVTNRFLWLAAPAGSPASLLARRWYSLDDAGPVASLWLPTPSGEAAPEGRGALVVLSADGRKGDLQLAGPPELDEKGHVGTWSLSPVPALGPGHWETAVPWALRLVTAGWWAIPGGADWTELTLPWRDTPGTGFASTTALHGGAPASGPGPVQAVSYAQANARWEVAQSLRTLLWSGRVKGGIVSVVAVTVPSGAHVITLSRYESGPVPGNWSAPFVRPAGPLEDVCLATSDADGNGGDPGLFVLGPVGAVRAVVGGQEPGTTLTDEQGSVPVQAPDGTPVAFVDAAGKTLCSTTVNATTETFEPHA